MCCIDNNGYTYIHACKYAHTCMSVQHHGAICIHVDAIHCGGVYVLLLPRIKGELRAACMKVFKVLTMHACARFIGDL